METVESVLLVIHLFIAIALIAVVLLQRSEGGALGIGGGGGGSLFSSRGVGNALTRTTAILAVIFFATSIALTLLATRRAGPGSILDNVPAPQGQTQPKNGGGNNQGGSVLPNLPPAAPAQPQVPVSP
jgi:preprotein translocase subunit SecG